MPTLLQLGVVAVLTACHGVIADTTTKIDSGSNWGTWDGWGVSLAWWAKAFGNRDDLADIFFTTKSTKFGSQTLPGLGFTIARYNAGASSTNSYNGASMVVASTMKPSRQIDGYWLDWASTDPASSSWSWSVDSNQRAMVQKAASRGANRLELFSNSPMWWMCSNHNPAGADNGGNNLQSWNYQDHALYLATIALYAKNNWGINFESVDPFNEPAASWWKGTTGTQEGCHVDASIQSTIIPYMRSQLNSKGLSSVIVAASDESLYDQAISTWNTLSSTAKSAVARINVHGYQYGGGARDTLYSLASAAGKKLWNSEYGESDATGNQLASNLLLDFRWLRPTGWVYWQAIDGGGWGLIDGDNDAKTLGSAGQKYFVLAQFARHIRPGMRILDGGASNVVAAYDSSAKKLVIVAVNWGAAQYLNFDLSNFSSSGTQGAKIPRWSTAIGSGNQYVSYPSDTTLGNGIFWSYFATMEVQTFEVGNISL